MTKSGHICPECAFFQLNTLGFIKECVKHSKKEED